MNTEPKKADILKRLKLFIVIKILVLLFCQTQLLGQERGFRLIENFTFNDYDHYPQNWEVKQAKNGIIYVANGAGILEYDGVSWRVIYVPNGPARSLDIGENGVVFIGGQNEIGFLKPGENGELTYKSLLQHIPEPYKTFEVAWKTHALHGNVYFRTSDYLLRWDGKRFHVWDSSKGKILKSFLCSDSIYIQQKKRGLLKISGNRLVPLPGGKTFEKTKIYMIAPFDAGNGKRLLLVGTRHGGFFLYNGQSFQPFHIDIREELKNSQFCHGIVMPSGDIALATLKQGVFLLNQRGELIETIDMHYGLQDQNVKSLYWDRQGNLWLSLNNGISRIEYHSPVTLFDKRAGLNGFVLAVTRHNTHIYVGTTQGLFRYQALRKFQQVGPVDTNCRSLVSIDDTLLAATSFGVFSIKGTEIYRVKKGVARLLLLSSIHPGSVWCAMFDGIFLLSREGKRWTAVRKIKFQGQVLHSMKEDKNGNLWIGTSTGKLYKISLPAAFDKNRKKIYDKKHGLPKGDILVTEIAGRLLVSTKLGLFRKHGNEDRFVPDSLLGKEFQGGNKQVFCLAQDKRKRIWFNSESVNYCAAPRSGKTFRVDSGLLKRMPLSQINSIYPDPAINQIWFAGLDGLFRFAPSSEKNIDHHKDVQFQTVIRKFMSNDHTIVFGASGSTSEFGKNTIFKIRASGLIRFEFAAPYFQSESRTTYSWLLEGYDSEWTEWSRNTSKNYFDLSPGKYTFKVRSKNVYGSESAADTVCFQVLAPWYRTWWALLLFGLFAAVLISLLMKIQRSKRIEKENIRLEAQVKERTGKISEQNEQLEIKTRQLQEQSEKLQELDRAKSRFFTNISHEFRTPLTLIINPIETMMEQDSDKTRKKHFRTMLNSAHRLLRLINQLLDLSRYDSGEIPLRTSCQNIVPFVKNIFSAFDVIAHQNRIQLDFRTSRQNIPVFFDAPRIEEVMYNLLINAFKYTPARGKITVFIRFQPSTPANTGFGVENNPLAFSGYAEISVKDTGKGIDKDHMPRIFDRFFQANGDKERLNTGTGIGLSVAKEIVELHCGTIRAISEPGKGTEFIIRLPIGAEHLDSGQIASSMIEGKNADKESIYACLQELDENGDNDDNPEERKPGAEKNGGGETDNREIILVVEDNSAVRKQIRSTLESKYSVIEARDGKKGIEKALEIIPDLIVSDIMMPKADGYELCRTLKKDVRTSHIPIILLTAKASEESIIRGYLTRADDYITKPFNTATLISRIGNLIDLRRQLQRELKREKMLLPPRIEVTGEDEVFLHEFQQIIEENMADPEFSIDVISEQMKIGRATLYRKIPALTGDSPNDFIKSYRLKRAAQLLSENKLSVTEVAGMVGFTSAHFSKIFKDKFHKTPKQYMISERKIPRFSK